MKNIFLYLFILFFCVTALSAIPTKKKASAVHEKDLVRVRIENDMIQKEIKDLEYELVLTKYQAKELNKDILKNNKNCCVDMVEGKSVKFENLSVQTDKMNQKALQIQLKLMRIQKLLEEKHERESRTYTSGISN